MKFSIFLILFFIIFSSTNIIASEQLDRYIINYPSNEYELNSIQKNNICLVRDLDTMYVPSRYIREALKTINGIIFKKMPDNISAYYNQLNKKIYFNLDLQNSSTRNLRRIQKMSLEQMATVFHEFWHAYFYTVAKKKRNQVYRNWVRGASSLYGSHGNGFHDEAYALYIEEILQTYVMIRNVFGRRGPEHRDRLRESEILKNMYENIFHVKIFGYYVNWRRVPIYTKVNLPEFDRRNILQNLFDNQLKRRYLDAFNEERF